MSMVVPTDNAADEQTRESTYSAPQTHWQELWHYRYLLYNLVARDIKVRYKNSVLGILWSLLNPILIMVVFTAVFSRFRGSGLHAYPVFVLVGLIPWNFFQGSVIGGANSIIGNTNLVKKVYFPREILPTATVLAQLVNFIISLVVLIVALYLFDLGLTRHIVWLPIIMVSQLLLTLGLAYFSSAAQVFYRDVGMILDVGMLAMFFLSPIIYTLDEFCRTEMFGIVFDPARVMRWINPMASIIDGYRTVLWGVFINSVETCGIDPGLYAGPSAMGFDFVARTFVTCLLIFIGGYLFFRRTEYLFGEKL